MQNRAVGVLMPISMLPGKYGEGAFGEEAYRFVDFLVRGGFSVWQVLPFCLPDDCHSPYKSYSSFSLNPNFIDLDTLRKKGLLTEEECLAARERVSYTCEFSRLDAERLPLLFRAASRVTERGEIDAFLAAHPETADFCRFMALRAANGERHHTLWKCDAPDESVRKAWEFVEYEAYTEWQALRDYANRKGVRIVGDLPIYVAEDSADVYFSPQNFLLDETGKPAKVAGVPPDYFSADGQLWGNPLYDYKRMKEDGFAFWRRRISFMGELFDGVRIDHFRGIESYFAIPASASTAREGVWHKGPGMALVRALREAAGDSLLIAEDLGEITPAVKRLLRASGLPGMRVFQFGFFGDESPHLPHNYENDSVAYTGTHDNDTLLGYLFSLDPATRRHVFDYIGYAGEEIGEAIDHVFRTMYASHAGILIFPIQDLLRFGCDTRLNTPGTAENNWAFRVTKEQLAGIDTTAFHALAALYGRLPAEKTGED